MIWLNIFLTTYMLLIPILIFIVILQNIYNGLHFELKYQIASFPSNVTWPIRSLVRKIEKFFYWGWTLRNDADWDYYHLYNILNIKLKRMRICIANGYSEESYKKKMLKSIDKAITLCDRLTSDDYMTNLIKVEKKWGQKHMVFHDMPDNMNLSRMYSYNENALNPKDQKLADTDTHNAYVKDDFLRTKDRIELFKIISDHIQEWWD